jgi:hypothetical protein
MFDLRKLFARELRARKSDERDPDSDYHPSAPRGEGLEIEYQGLIADQFRRWGIEPGVVTVEVQLFGRAPDGFNVFVGMVRLTRWDRASALRVLIGLPLLEAKVRKLVRGTWLADFSHFGGLWLHASESLGHSAGAAELRELMMQLAPSTPAWQRLDPGPAAGAASVTSASSSLSGSSERGDETVSG